MISHQSIAQTCTDFALSVGAAHLAPVSHTGASQARTRRTQPTRRPSEIAPRTENALVDARDCEKADAALPPLDARARAPGHELAPASRGARATPGRPRALLRPSPSPHRRCRNS